MTKLHVTVKEKMAFDGDWYEYAGKVHYWKYCLWPWPLNSWPWRCHQCHVDLVVNHCDKYHWNMSMYSGDTWENASQIAHLTISGLAVTLTFDLLTSKSNQFIFVPNCTEVVNLVKFPQAVCNILC